MLKKLSIKTSNRNQMLDITKHVNKFIKENNIKNGMITVFIPHTTAAVTINENADPDVKKDILYKLKDLIPKHDNYDHMEGNSDAHLKASIIGNSETIIIDNSELVLGTWQGIYFCEFDGPRKRNIYLKIN